MELYEQGHDVGAKSKNVFGFDEVSPIRSQYLISESKKCLQDQGINATSSCIRSIGDQILSTLQSCFYLSL